MGALCERQYVRIRSNPAVICKTTSAWLREVVLAIVLVSGLCLTGCTASESKRYSIKRSFYIPQIHDTARLAAHPPIEDVQLASDIADEETEIEIELTSVLTNLNNIGE